MASRRSRGRFCLRMLPFLAALRASALTGPDAITLEELVLDARLTPKRFAAEFETFAFASYVEVQPAEQFLRARRGDCDDYAILADYVLKPKGYATRIIHVRLVGRIAHAVCYVGGNSAYLDYNNRRYFLNLQRCGSSLRDIANKVAASFAGNWTSASEFTYDYQEEKKQFGATVVKTDPPSLDPDQVRVPPGRK